MTVRQATAFLHAAPLCVVLAAPTAWALEPRHSSTIQVSDDGATVWVVNPDSDSVGKIDAASNTLLGEFPVGDFPRSLAIDESTGGVYVANQGSQDLTPKPNPETVMRLDAAGNVTATYTTPYGCAPYGVIVNELGPSGIEVYVSCERRQEILVLDASLSTLLATVALDWPDPRSMALSAGRDRVYVAHFLTREPGSTAHVSEIDATQSPPTIDRVLEIPPDLETCETINSGTGVLNLLSGIHLTPTGAPPAVANQLWVGGVNQNNLTKGLFRRDRRFGGHAEPLLCEGGPNDGRRCQDDQDCKPGGVCEESFVALSRNLYKASFHDITRFQIAKIDLATGAVVGKIDVDEANQGTDIVFDSTGTFSAVVDQFFNSFHIFNTHRGQDGNATTLFASVSSFGVGGADPTRDCTGESFETSSEFPHILPPQVEITPIRADPVFVGGAVANTGNEYDVTTGQMRPVPDGIGTVPHGVAIHPNDEVIYVANFLSRNVVAMKADGFFCPNGSACSSRLDGCRCVPRVIAVIPSIDTPDPLPPQILDGKILFHTAARDASVPNGIGLDNPAPLFNFDDPLVLEPVGAIVSTSHDASYVACTSCHPEGGFDGRSWDFSQFGASIRNTMDLRGRASFQPGRCSDAPAQPCTTDSECGTNGVGTCSNDPSVVCELDVHCGACEAASPTPGITCIADAQCGGLCSNDASIACTADGDCGGLCREDGTTPCTSNADCVFGCEITNECDFFTCETQTCDAAKCRPADLAEVPRNVTDVDRFLNPMGTVHWNGDRDEVEDFEFTFRSLLGAGDCDGVEHLPDRCIGALVMRSNVAKPQEANPDLGEPNRGLSPRLDHLADYTYSLTSFVRNPNLPHGVPSPEAAAGRLLFNAAGTRCAECHDGPSEGDQLFTDKRPDPTHALGQAGGPDSNNPFIRHNVGTFNAFDLTDPFEVASDIGQFQNAALPIPGSRGQLLEYVTPSLVDVWNTRPYNHDGRFATLLHGVVPCNSGLDDCDLDDAGKNIDDQHGTTSNLTPAQLRTLVAFLEAPHGPIAPDGTVVLASPIQRLSKSTIRFGEGVGDDAMSLKRAVFELPSSAHLDTVVVNGRTYLDEPVTISMGAVADAFYERTLPAGSVEISPSGKRLRFRDPTGTIAPDVRRLVLKRTDPASRRYELSWTLRHADLGSLETNHITIAVEIGEDAFVRTRSFVEHGTSRRRLTLSER